MTDPTPMPTEPPKPRPAPAPGIVGRVVTAVLVGCLALFLGAAVANALTPMEPAHLTRVPVGTP